ncbi:MAG: hypothetical protein HY307_04335 [Arcobacter sp.]|nr:hypothetical protein [Arcobacter sp.]
MIHNIFQEQIKTDILHNIITFSTQIKNLDDIDDKVKELHKLLGFRITIIDKNGVVLAESDKDKSLLENHLNRSEVLQSKHLFFSF